MTTSTEHQNGSVGTTTAAMATTSSSRTMLGPAMAPAEKPGKFFGMNFKRWQQKMFFYLTTLSLQCFISEDVPVLGEETPDNERFVVIVMETSKELWNALEKKYKTEDAGLKKFVVAKFLNFNMVDSESAITQVQELQVIVHDLLAEGMVINEAFQAAAFIKNLPPMCKDFKNYLKYKRKDMTIEDLTVRLRIEENNKAAEKKSCGNSTIMGANIIEEASTNKAAECRAPKKDKKKSQANMIEKNDEIDDLCVMLSECNLVGNPREWWIDSGATRDVCANKELFTYYAPAGPNETVLWQIPLLQKLKERAI
ncbi:PREDICTED: uncharacterized protein LOC109231473 [Nicotiana attenuata]|uniref:uncharacterized protein LOC109231473 n=1 Tax=Nicotiana attenuata TaxID=49451 RepID=UPI000904932F|nr:PREDICTED: uncharacterized protein LOC109231473 [Nicotiana attenuata]